MKKLLILLLLLVTVLPIFACTVVLVGKDVSATGLVMIGRNEDNPDVSMRHYYVEAKERTGFMPEEEGRASLKEEGMTFGYYWTEALGPEGGVKAADSMINENGVFIGSNNCSLSKENTKDESRVKDGGLEYNLRRYVAEHATSARHGVELMISLVEEYGYAPSGRTYTIADKDEAWAVALVSGRHYVARRVQDDEIVIIPNHYTIHELREGDLYSEDLISYATEKGWYDGTSTFDFAKVYQAAESYGREYNTLRQATSLSYFGWNPESELPFGIKAQKKVTIDDLKEVLAIHDVGLPMSDDVHAESPRGVCTQTTVESCIYLMADEPENMVLLTAYGHPCVLPFIPSLPLAGMALVDTMDPEVAREQHLAYAPGANSFEDDLWHFFRSREYVIETQEGFLRNTAKVSKRLLENTLLFAEDWSSNLQIATNTMGTLLLNEYYVEPVDLVFGGEVIINFYALEEPTEDSLVLYRPQNYQEKTYFRPLSGSLTRIDEDYYSVAFDFMDVYFTTPYPGQFEYVLQGMDKNGKKYGGQVVLNASEF